MESVEPRCSRCGRPAAPTERYCAHCGTGLRPAVAPDAVTGEFVSAPGTSTPTSLTSLASSAGDSVTAASSSTPARALSSDGPLAPGQRIGNRYTIIKLLGRGGMGAVYQAWDDELMVAVAIKVILPDADDDPATRHDAEQRFKRELLLARQVSHKNVVRIHDLGDVDGLKYITMSFIEGETLAAMLRRESQLPVAQVLSLARQIGEGLAAAHEVGIVHRDLKPENIMVTPDGHTVIMDFGIARSAAKGSTQTRAGTVLGTLEYMAPEQARAEAIDQRVDVYALGLIMYDMLVGRTRAVGRDHPMSELMARLQQVPPPPRRLRQDVPDALEQIVMKAIQPVRDARFATAADVVAALSTLAPDGHRRPDTAAPAAPGRSRLRMAVATTAVVLTALAATFFVAPRESPPPAAPDPVAVLVADFTNETGDPVFDGVVEQALGLGIESASFVSTYPRRDALRTATLINAGTVLDEPTAHLVALREGVINVIVAGAIEPRGNGYRIATRVAAPGRAAEPLYSLEIDAAGKAAVLEAVGTLAGRVRAALGDANVSAEGPSARETFTAASLEAARAYAAAQELQILGQREKAIAAYQEAIRLDPNLGRAYSGLAANYANIGRIEDAEATYQQALALIDRMTPRERYRTLGSYYLFARKPEQALEQYQALMKAYPHDDTGLTNSAFAMFQLRQLQQAYEQGRRGVELQPNNGIRRLNVALYAMYAGHFDAAITLSDDTLTLTPSTAKAYVARALSELALGRAADAQATYTRLAALSGTGRSFADIGLADVALYEGRIADAIDTLTRGIAADHADRNSSAAAIKQLALAEAYLARGDQSAGAREALAAVQSVSADSVRAAAGLLLARAGRARDAEAQAAVLEQRLENDPQAYAQLVRTEVALAERNGRAAVERARAAQKLADTWPGRVLLGRAYLAVDAFAEAYSELQAATARRGEATSIFLDDWPTYRAYPPVLYYLGLAQEGLKTAGAGESFRAFLAIKARGDEQGLVADARKRTNP